MIRIYVVFGCTGDYEDYYEWMEKAYTTKESAKFAMGNLEFSEKNRKLEYDKSWDEHSKKCDEFEELFERISVDWTNQEKSDYWDKHYPDNDEDYYYESKWYKIKEVDLELETD